MTIAVQCVRCGHRDGTVLPLAVVRITPRCEHCGGPLFVAASTPRVNRRHTSATRRWLTSATEEAARTHSADAGGRGRR